MIKIFNTSQVSGRLPLLLIAVAAVGFAQPVPVSGTKTFNPATIAVGQQSTMTISIFNGNNPSLGNTNFIDTFPAGMVVSATPNVVSPCGGNIVATPGSGTLTLSNMQIGGHETCNLSLSVTGTIEGSLVNSVIISANNAPGTVPTVGTLTVVTAPPTISKAFSPTSVTVNTPSTLSFNLGNPNPTTTLTGIGVTDTLPAGLVVSSPPSITGTCGGTITAVAGSGSVSIANSSLTAGSSCSFSVSVTPTTVGAKNNVSGNVTSTQGGSGGTASATLTATAFLPPTFTKAFNPTSIVLNGTSVLTFSIANPNGAASASGVAFTDSLPAGLVVAASPGTTNTCNGTVTAVAGSGSISLSGGTLAASANCSISVNVTATTIGVKNNVSGNLTSTEGGDGGPALADLTVTAPTAPTFSKSFSPSSVTVSGNSTLSFSIGNPNASTALSGVAFTDTLPAGVVVAATPSVTNTCGGTVTAVAASGSISLSGGTLAASASCAISVSVTATTTGTKNNVTGNITSTESGNGGTASATLTSGNATAPTFTKAFSPTSIVVNGTSALTFSISNPNASTALNAVAFTDTLPAGLVVATPSGLTGTCGGGTITAVAGAGSISLSGAVLAGSASCSFTVNVTPTTAGAKNNATDPITSTESGAGLSATATLTATAAVAPTITTSFNPAGISINGTSTLSYTITNPNAAQLTGVAFSNTLPSGVIINTPNGLSGSCGGGTITAVAGSGSVSLTGATLAASASCTFSVVVKGTTSGPKNNTTGAVSSTEGGTGGTASATLTVANPATGVPTLGTGMLMVLGALLAIMGWSTTRRWSWNR